MSGSIVIRFADETTVVPATGMRAGRRARKHLRELIWAGFLTLNADGSYTATVPVEHR